MNEAIIISILDILINSSYFKTMENRTKKGVESMSLKHVVFEHLLIAREMLKLFEKDK